MPEKLKTTTHAYIVLAAYGLSLLRLRPARLLQTIPVEVLEMLPQLQRNYPELFPLQLVVFTPSVSPLCLRISPSTNIVQAFCQRAVSGKLQQYCVQAHMTRLLSADAQCSIVSGLKDIEDDSFVLRIPQINEETVEAPVQLITIVDLVLPGDQSRLHPSPAPKIGLEIRSSLTNGVVERLENHLWVWRARLPAETDRFSLRVRVDEDILAGTNRVLHLRSEHAPLTSLNLTSLGTPLRPVVIKVHPRPPRRTEPSLDSIILYFYFSSSSDT